MHQSNGNILLTFKVQNMVMDDENPWNGILASTVFALRATLHTTQYTPAQLIFGRDSIINWRHNVDWEIIRERKQDLINKGNKRENHTQINPAYEQGDKVLLKKKVEIKIEPRQLYRSPRNHSVRNNGTVGVCKGRLTYTFNIKNLTPYKQ